MTQDTGQATEPPAVRAEAPMRGARRVIAERMMASLQGAAQLTLTREVDATEFVAVRKNLNEGREDEERISYDALLVLIVSRALAEHPELNARLEDDKILQLEDVNVGVAVETARTLLVPVISDAASKTLDQIAGDLRDVIERIAGNKITLDELAGGTFTITNLGLYGVDAFTPILNAPECGILGIGRIRALPVVAEGSEEVAIRQMMVLSLTFDHRLVDGAPAARFLGAVAEGIEQPEMS